MKIIVLAGGLSTERDVSLASAAGICRTLVQKGHDAFLLDVFMGLENAPENLEDVFTLPGQALKSPEISVRRSRILRLSKLPVRISPTVFWDRMSSNFAAWPTLHFSDFTAEREKTENCRLLSTCSASATPAPIHWDVQ